MPMRQVKIPRYKDATRSGRSRLRRITLDHQPPLQSCGKVGYRSRAHAERALEVLAEKRAREGNAHVERRVYPCTSGPAPCYLWHTTSAT